jgi:hypothetical protein
MGGVYFGLGKSGGFIGGKGNGLPPSGSKRTRQQVVGLGIGQVQSPKGISRVLTSQLPAANLAVYQYVNSSEFSL